MVKMLAMSKVDMNVRKRIDRFPEREFEMTACELIDLTSQQMHCA
jgi:hypothetical protein